MFSKQDLFLVAAITLVLPAAFSNAQLMRCSYGERGSLTATCINATSNFFRATSYRFDSLDETLKCVNCNLDVLEANTFDISANQIITLDLKNSRISTLKESAFVGLVFMKNLLLQDNSIKSIVQGTFRGVKKVEALQLSNNSLSAISANVFKDLINLTVLFLDRNLISSIDIHGFDGLASLSMLNLANNKIKDIEHVFSSIPHLHSLDLSYNDITEVKSHYFENMTTLLFLDLGHNQIKSLPPYAFALMRNLQKLDLSSNNIQTIDHSSFLSMRNLETLNLNNNSIKEIEKYTFHGLTDLRELDLGDNSIKYFKIGYYTGLPELRYLNLSNNEIVTFVRTGILTLPNLHTIDLSKNNLTDIDYKIVHHIMPKITYLVLSNNDWPCYLIKEIDDHFKEDNVKLSVDGLLLNTTCRHVIKEDNEVIQQELKMEEEPPKHTVHSYVIYPALFILFISNIVLFYLFYRNDQLSALFNTNGISRSRANLISSELQANDNAEY